MVIPSRYSELLSASSVTMVLASVLARTAPPVVSLGALLSLQHYTGGMARAGVTVGVLSVASIVGGPLAGAASDRWGQRWVTRWAGVLNAVATSGLAMWIGFDGSDFGLVLWAAAVGVTTAQIGALARARWVHLLSDPRPNARGRVVARTANRHDAAARLRETAMALESTLDELAFIAGPVLTSSAALLHPAAPLWLAAALMLVGTAVWSFDPHAAVGSRSRSGGPLDRSTAWWCFVLTVTAFMAGALIGSLQAAVTSVLGALGRVELGGYVLASYAVGSAVAGFSSVYLLGKLRPPGRVLGSAAACAGVGAALALAAGSPWLLAFGALLCFALAPYLIGVNQVAAESVDASRLAAVAGFIAAGVVAGVGVGTTVAGVVVDEVGLVAGQRVPSLIAVALLPAVAAVVFAATRGRRAAETAAVRGTPAADELPHS